MKRLCIFAAALCAAALFVPEAGAVQVRGRAVVRSNRVVRTSRGAFVLPHRGAFFGNGGFVAVRAPFVDVGVGRGAFFNHGLAFQQRAFFAPRAAFFAAPVFAPSYGVPAAPFFAPAPCGPCGGGVQTSSFFAQSSFGY